MARPVLRVNLYVVLAAERNLVRKGVLQQQAQGILPALYADIHAGNQTAVRINHCVDNRSANRAARKTADNVDVRNGGIGHVCANRARIVADSPRKWAVIALVCLDALAADALTDGVAVLAEKISKSPERGVFGLQPPFGIAVFRPQHHFVGGLQALPLWGVVKFVQCPANSLFVCGKFVQLWRRAFCG